MTQNSEHLAVYVPAPGETDYYMSGWYVALHYALLGLPVPSELVLRVVDVPHSAVPRIAELACGRQQTDAPYA